jgi:hypothetical protein
MDWNVQLTHAYMQTVNKTTYKASSKQAKLDVQEEATTGQYGTMGADHAPGDLLSTQDHTNQGTSSHSRRLSNVSGDTLVNTPDDDGAIPFRQLLTGPVLLSIANYGMLAILDISLGALQPLFFSTPIEFGGLGFSPARIGLVLGLFGILNGIYQGIFFARVVRWWGLRRTFMTSMSSFMVIFALFPIINMLARKYGVGAEVWIAIAIQLVFWVIMDMAYGNDHLMLQRSILDLLEVSGSIFMYITTASPSKRSLGSVNGAAQLTGTMLVVVMFRSANSLHIDSVYRPHFRPRGVDFSFRSVT